MPFLVLLADDISQHLFKKILFLRIYASIWWHKRIPTIFSALPNGGTYDSFGPSPGLEITSNLQAKFLDSAISKRNRLLAYKC